MKFRILTLSAALLLPPVPLSAAPGGDASPVGKDTVMARDTEDMKNKDDEYWREKLTPEQYHVCREGGTERPFTGQFYKSHEKGTYVCSACGAELFSSDTKFDSGTGWPSFYDPINTKSVTLRSDHSHGMSRTEVRCAKCDAHLGHVFNDGPNPTGKRYCINSISLDLKRSEAK